MGKQCPHFDFNYVRQEVQSLLDQGRGALDIAQFVRDYHLLLHGKLDMVNRVFELKGKMSQQRIAEELAISQPLVSMILNWKI